MKKIFSFLLTLVILAFTILFLWGVVRPAYKDYKANKKEVVVDISGERATSKKEKTSLFTNILSNDIIDTSNVKFAEVPSSDGKYTLEENPDIKGVNSFTFDDRILLHEGQINYNSILMLVNTLIEDIDSKTYSKVDVKIENVRADLNKEITFENEEEYTNTLKALKETISNGDLYDVKFEYNKIKTVVNKVIITKL